MYWLHFISLFILIGIAFSLRYLVLPALVSLTPEQSVQLMGTLMPRVRRAMRLSLFVLLLSGIFIFADRGAIETLTRIRHLARLVLTLVVAALVLFVTISPHRRLALRLEPQRKRLLEATLASLIALMLLSLPYSLLAEN